MQENSRTDIGHFLGLDQRRNGTELTRTNRMENGIVSLRTWCSTSVKVDIQYSVDPVLWNEEIWKTKEKEHFLFISVVTTSQPNWFFAESFPSISSVADMRVELTCRISGCSESSGKLVRSEQFRDHGDANRIVDNEQNATDQWQSARKLPARLRTKIRQSSRSSSTDQTVLQCRYREDRGEGTVFHDPRRCGTGPIGRLMSRVHCTSRQRSIQSKRMDPWEHEDRSFGGGSYSPSRPSRNREHDQDDREWNEQVRDGNDGGNPREPHRWHWRQHRETAQGNLLLKQDRNKHQCRRLLLQRLLYHLTSVNGSTSNQVSTTRAVSKCQKRWSDCFDTILQYFEKETEQSTSESWHRCFVQNLRRLSIGQFEHGWITCKKEAVLKRNYSIVWIHTLLIPSCTFEQFKATLERNTLILHSRTTCCYRATSPSTSTTLEAPTIRTRSFNQDWFRVAKTSRKGDMRCSSRPWTQCSSIIIEKRLTTWRSQGLQCANTIGNTPKHSVLM